MLATVVVMWLWAGGRCNCGHGCRVVVVVTVLWSSSPPLLSSGCCQGGVGGLWEVKARWDAKDGVGGKVKGECVGG
jgi:hypothetical protein